MSPLHLINSEMLCRDWKFNLSIHPNLCDDIFSNQCMYAPLASLSTSLLLTIIDNLVIFHNEIKPLMF